MKPEFVHGNLKWGIGNAYPAGGSACLYVFRQQS